MFLMETKKRQSDMEWIQARLKFDNCLAVDCVGKSDDFALLWDWVNEANIDIQSYSRHHI